MKNKICKLITAFIYVVMLMYVYATHPIFFLVKRLHSFILVHDEALARFADKVEDWYYLKTKNEK